ncbi:MAG: DUF3667 domain-containing protein [Flavobacterium sp.]
MNWHYIKDEANYTLLHFNKGLLYTIKELFTRPGATIKEFIEGKRINHYKPLLLVFVLAGVSGFLSLKMDMKTMMQNYNTNNLNDKIMQEYTNVMHEMFSHYAFLEILALPIVSFASWLAFKKWGYNYIENIIINCFATGQRLVFSIVCILFYLVIPAKYLGQAGIITSLATFGFTIWTYASLYKDKKKFEVFLRISLFLLLLLVIAFILMILFIIVFFAYLKKTGRI